MRPALRHARPLDGYLNQPRWDYVPVIGLSLALGAITYIGGGASAAAAAAPTLYVGISTLGGIVLAVATYAAGVTQQTAAYGMERYRERSPERLRGNWRSVFTWTVLASVLPLVAVIVYPAAPPAAVALACVSLSVLAAKGARTVAWLQAVLFLEDVEAEYGRPISMRGTGVPIRERT